jgi:transcriptional regulator with XRE-family HTH domain
VDPIASNTVASNMAPSHQQIPNETLGTRIARLRNEGRMTQAELAERVAISRVALSNLESGRSVPGERTVALLSGVFDMEPHELIEETGYPSAKADRLPLAVARYTRAQLLASLLERDLTWIEGSPREVAARVLGRWHSELTAELATAVDPVERSRLEALRQTVMAEEPDTGRAG